MFWKKEIKGIPLVLIFVLLLAFLLRTLNLTGLPHFLPMKPFISAGRKLPILTPLGVLFLLPTANSRFLFGSTY